jgi:hypothetical protein
VHRARHDAVKNLARGNRVGSDALAGLVLPFWGPRLEPVLHFGARKGE